MSKRSRRARSSKSNVSRLSRRNRSLRAESLEPREVLSGSGWSSAFLALDVSKPVSPTHIVSASSGHANIHVGNLTPTPTFTKSPSVAGANGNTIYGKSATVSVQGMENNSQSGLTYSWQLVTGPQGGTATFSANGSTSASSTTITFNKCGSYQIKSTITDAYGKNVQSTFTITVAQVATSVVVTTGDAKTVLSPNSPYAVTGTSASVAGQAFDQFGNAISGTVSWYWATTSGPSGPRPTIVISGNLAYYKFNMAGAYNATMMATAGGQSVSATFSFNVVAQAASISASQQGGTANVTTASTNLSIGQILDQFHNPITAAATYAWSTTTSPSGVPAPTFSTSGTTTTVTFRAAGNYVFTLKATLGNSSLSTTVAVTVVAVPASIVSTPAAVNITTATTTLPTATLLDQFGNIEPSNIRTTWTLKQAPSGAPAVTLSGASYAEVATFGAAGTYVFTDSISGGLTYNVTVNVAQTLTKINLTPQVSALQGAATQQFTAQAIDQFGSVMTNPPTWAWRATDGTISGSGLFTAPNTSERVTVYVTYQTVSTLDTLTVTASNNNNNNNNNGGGGGGGSNFLGLGDTSLATLVKTLDSDGSISRNDMLQIFTAVANNGTLSTTDFNDLKTILADATQLNMPGYVQVLSHDVILGNAANATYLGTSLGNLAAGNSAANLNNLVGKWFLGSDLPTTSFGYAKASGTLFPTTPSYLNEHQGELGDCYFISSLGMIADNNPTAIQSMFIDNGDGTFTVRFYGGAYGGSYNSDGSISDGFNGGKGTADYVTVNMMLPNSGGAFVYANYGQSLSNTGNALWLPLAEKAYAQWNQTGNEGRNNTNTYSGIEGGWMGVVDAQVLGYNATDYYSLTAGNEQAAINALNTHQALTMATTGNGGDGLYGSHAYGVLSYNASTGMFTLYNPWGFAQPGQLTWAQLEADCDGFVIANPTSSTAAKTNPALVKLGPKSMVGVVVEAGVSTGTSGHVADTSSAAWARLAAPQSNDGVGGVATGVSGGVATVDIDGDVALSQSSASGSSLDARSVDAIFADLDRVIELV